MHAGTDWYQMVARTRLPDALLSFINKVVSLLIIRMGTLKDQAKHCSRAFDGAQALADVERRSRKADKIKAVLKQEGMLPNDNLNVLDIGCSFGLILKNLVSEVGYGVGTDIDRSGMRERAESSPMCVWMGECLLFRSECFGVVICNHVYEHTDDPKQMLAEIERVLTPTGVCYFAGPNKYEVIETHYRLPFLSWLPRTFSGFYLRVTGKGETYTQMPYSYPALMRLLSKFEITDYTAKILADPIYYNATDMLMPGSFKKLLPKIVFKLAPFVFPGFVFVLRKRTSAQSYSM